MMAETKFELIIVLVNPSHSEIVMDAAREVGARGGTIVHARGTGTKDIEKKYNVVITPDKEMILILAKESIRDKMLQAIYKAAGLGTDGQGIAFALPVNDVIGLKI
jgi:nitrogen regulatory protein PII